MEHFDQLERKFIFQISIFGVKPCQSSRVLTSSRVPSLPTSKVNGPMKFSACSTSCGYGRLKQHPGPKGFLINFMKPFLDSLPTLYQTSSWTRNRRPYDQGLLWKWFPLVRSAIKPLFRVGVVGRAPMKIERKISLIMNWRLYWRYAINIQDLAIMYSILNSHVVAFKKVPKLFPVGSKVLNNWRNLRGAEWSWEHRPMAVGNVRMNWNGT